MTAHNIKSGLSICKHECVAGDALDRARRATFVARTELVGLAVMLAVVVGAEGIAVVGSLVASDSTSG